MPARLQHGGAGRIDNQGWTLEPLLGLQLGALPQRHRPPAGRLAQPQGSGWGSKRGCSNSSSNSLPPNHRRGSQLHQQALHEPVFAHRAIAEALQMGGAKSSLQVLHPLLVWQPRHLQTPLTAGGPQLQLHPNPASCPLGQIPQPAQVGEALLLQLGAALTQQGQAVGAQRQPRRALQQQPLLGHAEAIGGKHPRQGVEQHPRHSQHLGQAAGMLTASPAVAHQQGLAQVVAALDRDAAQGFRHRFNGDLQGPCRQPLRADPRCHRGHLKRQLRKPSPHRFPISGLVALGAKHRWQGGKRQTAQQHVGIGDGERPAAAVSRRTGISACRNRPNLQPPAVKAQHRAAASSHGVNRQHRSLQFQPSDLGGRAALPGQITASV